MFGGYIQITYHCPPGSWEGDGQDNRSKKGGRGSSCCLVVNHTIHPVYTMSIPMLLPSTSTIHAMHIQYPYQMANSDPTFGGAWDPPAFCISSCPFSDHISPYHKIRSSQLWRQNCIGKYLEACCALPCLLTVITSRSLPTCLPVQTCALVSQCRLVTVCA